MDFKRWFKEDKGRFGTFILVVLVSLVFYALKPKDPISFDLRPIKELKATKMVVAREPIMAAAVDSGLKAEPRPAKTDSTLAALSPAIETAKSPSKKVATNTKPKPKSTRKLSREDIVKRKLETGMTVKQIAKATGYEKKYIRKVKKGKLCYY